MTPEEEQAKIDAESKFSMEEKARSLEVMEREANQFAMCLLMPEQFVRDEVAKLPRLDIADERAIEKLAKKFRVSVPVMTLRLGQISFGAGGDRG